jgi:diphthamide synthase (EF-2-diphthine--ammonia ligase)
VRIVAALLTTVTGDYDRISMHGVRRSLLEQQAASLALPAEEVIVPKGSSNEEYERRMADTLNRYREAGVTSVVFGDIFLEDLRQYREENLSRLGLKGVFPLWKRDTVQLMKDFIGCGFKAVTVCVDNHFLGREFVGRTIDAGLWPICLDRRRLRRKRGISLVRLQRSDL